MPASTPENDNATTSRTDKAVVCDALVSCLVAFERPDGTECMMEVEAPSLNYAGAMVVEKLTGYKLKWAMKTGGELKPPSRWHLLLARLFLRYS